MRLGGRKDKTIETYESYIKPFVTWIKNRANKGRIIVTSNLVKVYLDETKLMGEYSSYERIRK